MKVSKEFYTGELVWAKMKGFSPWPARIAQPATDVKVPKQKKPQHYVYFFGSNNYAWILDENIVPHSKHMILKTNKKKSAALRDAIELITRHSKNKSTDKKSFKPKTEKTSKNRILNKSKSVKKAIQNVKQSEEKSFKTRHKNRSTVEALKKAFKSPLQSNGIADVLSFSKIEESKVEKKSLRNKSLNAVEALKKPFKSPIQTNGVKDVRLSSTSKPLKTNGHNKHCHLTPKVTSRFRQSVVSLDGDLCSKRTKYWKCKGQALIKKPMVPLVYGETDSNCLKETNAADKKIGFLGLGLIGSGIVKNLLQSGHHVSIYNRNHEKCDHFVKDGAYVCVTPADVVKKSDIIFSCNSDANAANSLLLGEFGVLSGLKKYGSDKGYVEMTLVDFNTAEKLSSAITMAGARYLEAPVLSSRIQADKGTLLVFAAGDNSLFLDCATYFKAMGKHAFYIDSTIGNASKYIALLSMLHNVAYISLAETMALAGKVEIGQYNFMQLLETGSLNCPAVIEKGHAIYDCNFEVDTPVKHMKQAVKLFTEMTKDAKSSLPIAVTVNEIFKHPKLESYEDKDISSLYLITKT